MYLGQRNVRGTVGQQTLVVDLGAILRDVISRCTCITIRGPSTEKALQHLLGSMDPVSRKAEETRLYRILVTKYPRI